MVMEFTNGDMSILPKLIEFSNLKEDNEWFKKQATINEYIQPALQLYFKNSNKVCSFTPPLNIVCTLSSVKSLL